MAPVLQYLRVPRLQSFTKFFRVSFQFFTFFVCRSMIVVEVGVNYQYRLAAIAQLGERQTEDLKVPGSIPGGGIFLR